MKKREVWQWLLLVLWVEMDAMLVLRGWLKERAMLIQTTNLLAATPSGEWWIMMTNIGLLVLGMGVALWCLRRYGVMFGLALFVLALVVLEG